MWLFLVLTVALLANHAQAFLGGGGWAAVTRKAVVDMREADVDELADAIEMTINRARLPCMAGSKATLAFGLLTPRITMRPAGIVKAVLASTAGPVPMHVQALIPHIVARIVRKVVRPIHDMPEMKPIAAGGIVASKIDQLVNDIQKNVPDFVTGDDVIARVTEIIGILKGKTCDQLMTEAQVVTFVDRAEALLDLDDDVALRRELIAEIMPEIVALVDDAVVAREVAMGVVGAVEQVLENIEEKTEAIAEALPGEIPVAIAVFLTDLIKMTRIGLATRSHIDTPTIDFPEASDECYEQKLATYNAGMLRLFTDIQRGVINGAVGKILAGKRVGGLLMPRDTLFAGLREHHLTNVLRLVKEKTGWLWETLLGLGKAARLDVTTAAKPLNKVLLATDDREICDINPKVLVDIVSGAYRKAARTVDANTIFIMDKKLRQVLDGSTVDAFIAELRPVIKNFRAAFKAMRTDWRNKQFSIGPFKAIVNIIADIATTGSIAKRQGVGAGADIVIKDMLSELKLTGDETLMTISDIQLHQVIAKIAWTLKQHIPDACRKAVAIRITKGIVTAMVKQSFMKTMETALYIIEHDVQPANMAIVRDALMNIGIQWIEKFVASIPTIGDIAGEDEVDEWFDVAGLEKSLVEVLPVILGKAAMVIRTEIAVCHQHAGIIPSWMAFMHSVAQQLIKESQVAVAGGTSAVVGDDVIAALVGGDLNKVQQCKTIIDVIYGNLFTQLITGVSSIAEVSQPKIIWRIFIDLIVQHIRIVTGAFSVQHTRIVTGAAIHEGAAVHGGAAEGAALLNEPILAKIVTKYAQISAHVLEGMTSQPVTEATIEQIIHQVVGRIASQAGQEGIVVHKIMEHILEILKGVAVMGDVPSDIIFNTAIMVAGHIKNTVPAECHLPVMTKFMAALLVLHTDLLDVMPEHPLLAALTPIIQAANPASPVPLEKAVAILEAVIAKIKHTAIKARGGLRIFDNVAVVKDVLAMVIAPIQPGETAMERFHGALPHIEMLVNGPDICEPIGIADVMNEASQYITRIMEAPVMQREQLGEVLKAVLPEEGEWEVDMVLDAIVGRALPVMWAGFREMIDVTANAIQHPETFPQFFSHLIVASLGLDIAPMERLHQSPIFIIILDKVKTELIAHLMPISMVPAETLVVGLIEAYMRTMDILGMLPESIIPAPGMPPVFPPIHRPFPPTHALAPIMTQLNIIIHA